MLYLGEYADQLLKEYDVSWNAYLSLSISIYLGPSPLAVQSKI